MNEGHDAAGSSIGAKSSFFIGTALNLNMTDEQRELKLKSIGVRSTLAHNLS